MENILKQLKPELKQKLWDEQAKYPHAIGRVINILSDKHYWGDLTVDEIHNLVMYTDVPYQDQAEYRLWRFGVGILTSKK
jgi:hypothetical protein